MNRGFLRCTNFLAVLIVFVCCSGACADFSSEMHVTEWTWEESKIWPGADTYNGTFDSSFELTLSFEPGDRPDIVIKGFNRYDAYTKSNQITFIDRFNSKDSPLYREA